MFRQRRQQRQLAKKYGVVDYRAVPFAGNPADKTLLQPPTESGTWRYSLWNSVVQWEHELERGDARPVSSMKFVRHRPALFPLVVPCRVLAFPLSYTSAVTVRTYVPLIVISISLFFLVVGFLAIKVVYMKHRRIGTIHAPSGTVRSTPAGSDLPSSTSTFELQDKQESLHHGLLVGCLGSPTWETNLMSKLDGAWRHERGRGSSFVCQPHAGSTRSVSTRSKSKSYNLSSRLTKSAALGQLVLSPSRAPVHHDGVSSKAALRSVQRHAPTDCHLCYGDFGESHGVRSPAGDVANVARRASPSSIRLVDGPSHSSQVEYSFLSILPPNSIAVSPLMGTRDSLQLSRCTLKCNRKPVPSMPPLPSFLPFLLPSSLETRPLGASEYLPPFRLSPFAGVAKVFQSQRQVVGKEAAGSRVPDPDEVVRSGASGWTLASSALSKMQHASNVGLLTSSSVVQDTPTHHPDRTTNGKSNHKRWQSCNGRTIGGTSLQTSLLSDAPGDRQSSVLRAPGSCRNGRREPLRSCLRQACSPEFTLTPSLSKTSVSRSAGESLCTPASNMDIGILGLDRFHWHDERHMQSCHAKEDSIALVPCWEYANYGGWLL